MSEEGMRRIVIRFPDGEVEAVVRNDDELQEVIREEAANRGYSAVSVRREGENQYVASPKEVVG